MAGTAISSSQLNGILPNDHVSMARIADYDKILTTRDQVIAGIHERANALPRSPILGLFPTTKGAKQLPNGNALQKDHSHDPNANARTSSIHATSSILPPKPSTSVPMKPASRFDPVLLKKSDHLIREEMRLEREKLERSLKELFQQKPFGAKRTSDQEALPDFDVSDVLWRAQELVKPVNANETGSTNKRASTSEKPGSTSDTPDDKTMYSSQVNESTASESERLSNRRSTKPCKHFFHGYCRMGSACRYSHDPAFKRKLQGLGQLTADADNLESDNTTNSRRDRLRQDMEVTGGTGRASLKHDNRESGELTEDSPYSPSLQVPVEASRTRQPVPHYQPVERNENHQHQHHHDHLTEQNQNHQRHQHRQDPPSPQRPARQMSPPRRGGRVSPVNREARIVRNHITSPAAPQPARVSPLAVARLPRVERMRHGDDGPHNPRNGRRRVSGQQTPIISQPPSARKRRREIDVEEPLRNVAPRRHIESPVPQIKDEPMSPPPFINAPSHQYTSREEGRVPIEIGLDSPRPRERVVYEPVSTDRMYIERSGSRGTTPPAIRRVVSGPSGQIETYREPSLRRIVSTRQVERPMSPRDTAYYPTSTVPARSARAMSHYVVHPETEHPSSYRASVQPQNPAYVRGERPQSPSVRRFQYSPIEREPAVMAPPPRRIVMDQHGNKYYETPTQRLERRPSVIPEPAYTKDVAGPYEQPVRRASVRPEMADVYLDSRRIPRAMSPGPTSPRYIEPPRYVEYRSSVQPPARQAVYEQGEDVYRGRNEVVRVVEYPQERRLGRYEEVTRPREVPARMSSVRPQEIHYEIPGEGSHGISSIQPGSPRYVETARDRIPHIREIRETSTRVDDRYTRPRYVESSGQRYQYLPAGYSSGYEGRDPDGDVYIEGASEVDRQARL